MVKIEINDHTATVRVEVGEDFVPECITAMHALTGGLSEALHLSYEDALHLLFVGALRSREAFDQAQKRIIKAVIPGDRS